MVSYADDSDYKVLRDDHFDLSDGEEREIPFELPNDLSDNNLIVAYKARPIKSSGLQVVTTIDISLRFQQHERRRCERQAPGQIQTEPLPSRGYTPLGVGAVSATCGSCGHDPTIPWPITTPSE